MPERYSAAAYVRGVVPGSNAMAKDDNDNAGATIGLDLGRVLETQTRLLSSYQLAHRVIEQIGLIELRPELNEAPLPLIDIFSHSGNATEHKDDKAVAAVLRNLTVTSDPRAYLITVRYSDRDPQLAAVIADAFVAEFLRSVKLQALAQQRAAAQGALAKQLATFGPKHPKVGEAKARLASLDDLVTDELNKNSKNDPASSRRECHCRDRFTCEREDAAGAGGVSADGPWHRDRGRVLARARPAVGSAVRVLRRASSNRRLTEQRVVARC